MSDDCICEIQEKKHKQTQDLKKVDVLKTSIYDKKTIKISSIEPVLKKKSKVIQKELEESKEKEQIIGKPKGIVSKCNNISPLKLDDLEIDRVLVEYRRAPTKSNMCNILKLAGFNPNWTKSDVKKLLETPDGTMLLARINNDIQRLTGKDFISEEDITRCFPNYLKET
jgi:hypothetical protein